MPPLSNRYLIFILPLLVLLLWTFVPSNVALLSGIFRTATMDSLPSSFTIEVNGAPIAKVGDDAAHGVQAKTGPDAAVFTLKDSRLQCGDWVLGRSVKEDRSFLPKQVMWFKSAEVGKRGVQPVTASESGDSFLLRFANAKLIAEEGNLLADLQVGEGEEQATVVLTK